MIVTKSAAELAQHIDALKKNGETLGFVPTMGALHEGHLSLMRLADEKANKVIVSIYVNPTQFAPHEDFDAYPREVDRDLEQLCNEGVALAYLPSEEDIYPNGTQATIKAGEAAKGLESDFRPHFFGGVTTVVHELFTQVRPDVAVFGEKDFQQLQVIREMVETHDMGIEIIGAPIARDEHGLALSSRNAYLSEGELEIARMLNQVMYNVAQNPTEETLKEATEMLLTTGFDKVDYISHKPEWNRVLAAAWLGKTRLIDNCEALSQ